MAGFQAKDSLTLGRQLKVITLAIPFQVVGSATAASVSVTSDEPGLLFVNTSSTTQISAATGALDAGEATPTFQTLSDSAGNAAALVKVNEPVTKVVGAYTVTRSGATPVMTACPIANTTGLSANGNKICLNLNTTTAYNTTVTLNQTLYVSYIPTIG